MTEEYEVECDGCGEKFSNKKLAEINLNIMTIHLCESCASDIQGTLEEWEFEDEDEEDD